MNEVYAKYFGTHKPARSTVQAAACRKRRASEIDVIAVKDSQTLSHYGGRIGPGGLSSLQNCLGSARGSVGSIPTRSRHA